MSYILDALKKGEQDESSRGRLQLDNVGTLPKERRNKHWLFWAAVTLLSGAAIVLQVLIQNGNSQTFHSKPAETSFSSEATGARDHQFTEIIDPLTLTLSDLPKNLTNQIPRMEFSSHIYSQDSSLRSVTINNQIYRENDQIAMELYLEEINKIGIIVRYRGYLAEISFLEEWLEISEP